MSRENRSQVTVKTAATVALTVLGVAFAAWFLWNTTGALLITSAALLIAVALNRLVEWFERRGIRRAFGIAIAMTGVVGVLVGLGFLFIPPIVGQIEQVVNQGPQLLASFERTSLYRFLQQHLHIQQLVTQFESHAATAVGTALTVAEYVVEFIGAVVTVLFVCLFMLATGRRIVWALVAKQPEPALHFPGDLRHRVARNLGKRRPLQAMPEEQQSADGDNADMHLPLPRKPG